MKKPKTILVLLFLLSPFLTMAQYDPQYVETRAVSIEGDSFAITKMLRRDEKVKVKYFAAKNGNQVVYQRYKDWSATKNIVAYSSGTYMTTYNPSTATPVGFCVDNGKVVNELLHDKMDALVIVYATGGIVVTNLKDGNLKVKINETEYKTYDIRNNSYDKIEFQDWAVSQQATVFQTHLLAYKNLLTIGINSNTDKAARRFLAVCKVNNSVVYYVININTSALSLYDGASRSLNYLRNSENADVVFMINLDPGKQDVFKVFDKSGNEIMNKKFSGYLDISEAINLLVFYYE